MQIKQIISVTALLFSALSAQAAPVTVDGDFVLGTASGAWDGDSFDFNSGAGVISGWVFEAPTNVITGVTLNGSSAAWQHGSMFGSDSWTLPSTSLNAGAQTIAVTGNSGATFHANFTYAEAPAAAVPEPETYAMMLAGLGALGFVGRRRKAK